MTNSRCCTWLLREQAAEIFQGLAGTHRQAIEEFVPWFLDKARPYTRYFTGGYNFSFITYAYGRPRFAAWAKLGKRGARRGHESGNTSSRSLTAPGDARS